MRNGAISSLRLAELSDFISGTQNSNLEINEGEMRKITIVGLILLPAALFAQAPAPAPAAQAPKETSAAAASAGAGRVAVVDFQKAVVENAEGKKAQERFMAEVNKRQKDFEGKQKSLTDAQNKLQTQA